MTWIKRQMIRALPTCTLWRQSYNADYVYLVIAPWIKVTKKEFLELSK